MAGETTSTSMNDPIFTSWINETIAMEQRPYNVITPLCKYAGPRPTKRYDWPTGTYDTAASARTEGTAMTNVSLTTGVASATAGLNGDVATVTDVLSAVMVGDAETHVAGVLARGVAEERENTMAGVLDDFTNVTGTSGADLTVAQFLAGVNALEQRDATGMLVSVLHPIQTGDIRTGIQAVSNSHFHANPNFDPSVMQELGTPAGYAGTLFDVQIFHTSAITTNANAADREGAIFTKDDAVGYYEVWFNKTEMHRDIAQPGTQVAATSFYGGVVILDRNGQLIRTGAT